MNCRRAERLLSAQRDGQLTPRAEIALSAHLAQCAACRLSQEEFQMLGRELHTFTVPTTSRSLLHSAITQWQAEEGKEGKRERGKEKIPNTQYPIPEYLNTRTLRRASLTLALASLTLLVGLGLALRFQQSGRSEAMPTLALSVTPLQAEQMLPGRLQGNILPWEATTVRSVIPGGGRQGSRISAKQGGVSVKQGGAVPSERTESVEDMAYLNTDPASITARWVHIQPNVLADMERKLQAVVCGGDDFVTVPLPQIAGDGPQAVKAALDEYKQQKEIVDARLIHKVTLGVKGISFADLCQQLHDQTGIEIAANRSIADDKITLFCKDRPLRDLMRQINRLFGFLWTRTGEPNAFRYELSQPLNSQLTEEELRNRDRNEALIALDHEMQRYRNYLGLSPQQAKAQAENAATPEDKETLETLGGAGWGPAHLYFGLSPDDMAALANGQTLSYSQSPESDQERSLTPDLASGILQGIGGSNRVQQGPNGSITVGGAEGLPDGIPISQFPGAQTSASLNLNFGNVGEVALMGEAGATVSTTSTGPDGSQGKQAARMINGSALATGISPSTKSPQNATSNAKLAKDPALKPHITLEPHAPEGKQGQLVTTADVLEALYKATGKDIISDYYTRFYQPDQVTLKDVSLFDTLNRLSDTMRDRWAKESDWLQFRSAGFFNDRPKEVPNRLFERWAASQHTNGALTVNDFIEMAQLTDIQLNADTTAQGAHLLYGLTQWGHMKNLRKDWRLLASFSPALRQTAFSKKGILYDQLPLSIRRKFLIQLFGPEVDTLQISSNELTTAMLKVEYTLPANPSNTDGTTLPEPKFSYSVSGGPDLGHWTRIVTPTSESTSTPGGQRQTQGAP